MQKNADGTYARRLGLHYVPDDGAFIPPQNVAPIPQKAAPRLNVAPKVAAPPAAMAVQQATTALALAAVPTHYSEAAFSAFYKFSGR